LAHVTLLSVFIDHLLNWGGQQKGTELLY